MKDFASAFACCGLLVSACSQPQIENAPPGIVELCQNSIRSETEREPLLRDDTPPGAYQGSAESAIAQAASAEDDAETASPEDWPDDALLYRCLAANGVALTPRQTEVLADWQGRTTKANRKKKE